VGIALGLSVETDLANGLNLGLTTKKNKFDRLLTNWRAPREFPWRRDPSPYSTLVAELLLQRTRSDQVKSVYIEFISRWPDIKSLSTSNEREIHQVIKSLGLDYRAKRICTIAKTMPIERGANAIAHDSIMHHDFFGIGKYSRNAVLCFGFGDHVPIVDSNVVRIFSRVFSLQLGAYAHKKSQIWDLAKKLLPKKGDIRKYNWLLLDLGAEVCTPKNPRCSKCPLLEMCDYGKRKQSSS
jgi:A/G-specific adenine glycosylase